MGGTVIPKATFGNMRPRRCGRVLDISGKVSAPSNANYHDFKHWSALLVIDKARELQESARHSL
jgi:hypothetical protein